MDNIELKYNLPSINEDVLDSLPFGVYVINSLGVIEYANPEMAKISGTISEDELIGENVFDVANYKEYGLDKYMRLGLSGRPFNIEGIKYMSRNSDKKTYRSYHGIPIKNDRGQVSKLFCIVKDVTRQKELESEVNERKEEYEMIFRNLPFIAFTLNRRGKLLDANKVAEEFIGGRKEEFIGKGFDEFVFLEKKSLLIAAKEFFKNLQGKVTNKTIYKVKHNDGTTRKIELIGIPLKKDGKVIKILDVGHEVEEKKEK